MRYALVENGAVINVILLGNPERYACPEGVEPFPVDDRPEVGIGWARDGEEWVDTRPPPTPDPPVLPVPHRQQSPDGTWWEQRINNGGQVTWVRVDPAPASAPAAAPRSTHAKTSGGA